MYYTGAKPNCKRTFGHNLKHSIKLVELHKDIYQLLYFLNYDVSLALTRALFFARLVVSLPEKNAGVRPRA